MRLKHIVGMVIALATLDSGWVGQAVAQEGEADLYERIVTYEFAHDRKVPAAIEEDIEVSCARDFDFLHSFGVTKHRGQLIGNLARRTLCMFR